MTSSGVSTFNVTLNDIVTAAYRKAGIIKLAQAANAAQLSAGKLALNLLTKEWMKKPGVRTWTLEQGILFLQKDQSRYQLGSTSTDHATDAFDFDNTTTTVAAAAAAGTITVDDIGTIANADYIAVELDSGEFQWTTVNGAPAGSVVTLAAALTGAAALGNRVIAYTTKMVRPLLVIPDVARTFHYESLIESPADMVANLDYQRLPNKTSSNSPFTQLMYQPKLPLGIMTAWLVPSDVKYGAKFAYHRPIFDFVSNSDNPDFPIEWGNAMIWNLAKELIPDGDVPADRAAVISSQAEEKLAGALAGDRAPESISFEPDFGPDNSLSSMR